MELRVLRYFVAVADELHFGRAAQRLFIAQPSLSNQIRKLERELGTPLFTRDRHGVTLTEAGHALHEPARRLLSQAADLETLVSSASRHHDRLVIGYVPYARTVLDRMLQALRRRSPTATVTIRPGTDSPDVFHDLRDGHIDAGLVRAPVSAPWLAVQTVVVEPFYAALPAGHPLAGQPRLRLADLAEAKFAVFPRDLNPSAYDHMMSYFAAAGYTPTVVQASRRMEESLAHVATGAGVAIFPVSVTETATESGIVFRPLTDPTPTVEIVLGWDRHNRNPLIPSLVDIVQDRTDSPERGSVS